MIDVLELLADSELEAHTSIVLAYNADLLFYDKLVRRRFASAGVQSQLVFCDASCYAAALDEIDVHSRIGRAYSVTPVNVPGAFHPKAYLMIGRKRGRLIVGSGNASVGGLLRNAELFGRFDFDKDSGQPPHPAFAAVLELVAQTAAAAAPAVRQQVESARAHATWLQEPSMASDGRRVHLGGLGRTPLIEAISARVESPIRRVVALSASFDRQLRAVESLAALGQGDHEVVVAVQTSNVRVEGQSIARVSPMVRWTEFVDPRPSKKKEPADSYAHAKLVLIETEVAEHCFFGSANLSAPALLDGSNVETLVELPPAPLGTWVSALGLAKSLEIDVRASLLEKAWGSEDETATALVHLGGIEWTSEHGWVVVPPPSGVPSGARLALGANHRKFDLLLALNVGAVVAAPAPPMASVRFGWLVDGDGAAISHAVAIAWNEVARARFGSGLGERVDDALLAMKHGELLGSVLFEFLDMVPDLGIMTVRRGGDTGGRADEIGANDRDARPESSFFTDATPESEAVARIALGDRSDVDLLAALIQPLTSTDSPVNSAHGGALADDDDPDDVVDEGLSEEAERLRLDGKGGAAELPEPAAAGSLPKARRMRSAGRRFARRMRRAANQLVVGVGKLKDGMRVSPTTVARPVWMSYIAAFVAGRGVETSDEGEVVVVEPAELAHYVLRCGAALAGDAQGGLLRAVEPEAWSTREGETLARGVRFLHATCAWAVAWFEGAYPEPRAWSGDAEKVVAQGIHDAVPLFVLARLIQASSRFVGAPDFDDAERRVSAWSDVPVGGPAATYLRAQALATWMHDTESNPSRLVAGGPPAVGTAVLLKKLGLSMVLGTAGDKISVATLSRPATPSLYKVVAPFTHLPSVGRVLLAPVAGKAAGVKPTKSRRARARRPS